MTDDWRTLENTEPKKKKKRLSMSLVTWYIIMQKMGTLCQLQFCGVYMMHN